MDTSDDETSDADPKSYFHNISQRYFAAEPLWTIRQHKYFMELCLEHNNPEAHYLEWINQYFFHPKSIGELNHLCQSANGKYDKGTYLCGLLMLCRRDIEEEKELFDTLDWEHTLHKSNGCWRKIKKDTQFTHVVSKGLSTHCHATISFTTCESLIVYFKSNLRCPTCRDTIL